ncbi:MAG: glycoside hydrolase family 130 protein [Candidatus Schekmanbacteria bacterium]|nr:glycoside hydrolase family 130 protein [Candidatus Schekmanbacteria bacterium]
MIKPSQEGFEVVAAFNPGVVRHGDTTCFLIRVAERPVEKRPGFIAIPRLKKGEIVIDWQPMDTLIELDERSLRSKAQGYFFLSAISHLRLATSRDGINIDYISETPTIFPRKAFEEFGIEDPRITLIDDTFYITYAAVSRHGISTALASTKDFQTFDRHGIIFPTENKGVVIFPEKINNHYLALHRPLSANPFGPPEMWMAYSPDLMHWGRHHCTIGACCEFQCIKIAPVAGLPTGCFCRRRRASDWDAMRVGAGAPPLKTQDGWLVIYHGSYKTEPTDKRGVYCGGAALFDLNNPEKLLAKAKMPILVPERDYEQNGYMPNVVFPTGVVEEDGNLLIYYGAADTNVAVAKLSLQDVLDAILKD